MQVWTLEVLRISPLQQQDGALPLRLALGMLCAMRDVPALLVRLHSSICLFLSTTGAYSHNNHIIAILLYCNTGVHSYLNNTGSNQPHVAGMSPIYGKQDVVVQFVFDNNGAPSPTNRLGEGNLYPDGSPNPHAWRNQGDWYMRSTGGTSECSYHVSFQINTKKK